jgi:hypothetical protein
LVSENRLCSDRPAHEVEYLLGGMLFEVVAIDVERMEKPLI